MTDAVNFQRKDLHSAAAKVLANEAKQQAIEWCPIAEGGRLSFAGTTYRATRNALFSVFGEYPIRLNKAKHLQTLQAMSHVAKEANDGAAPYNQLADALRKYGDLEVRDL